MVVRDAVSSKRYIGYTLWFACKGVGDIFILQLQYNNYYRTMFLFTFYFNFVIIKLKGGQNMKHNVLNILEDALEETKDQLEDLKDKTDGK